MTIEYGVDVKTPWSQRINFRMLIVVGVIALLVGYPVFVLVQAQLNGGIKDVGGGYKQVDLKAMSSFEFDQTNGELKDIPEQWRNLDGQKVVMYGEMWAPQGSGADVDSFQLCYSIAKCCFNGPPLVQHFVDSHAMPGKDLSYYSGQVKVEGILHVAVERDAGKVSKIYHLQVASIEPAT
jgi:hypothetical protein